MTRQAFANTVHRTDCPEPLKTEPIAMVPKQTLIRGGQMLILGIMIEITTWIIYLLALLQFGWCLIAQHQNKAVAALGATPTAEVGNKRAADAADLVEPPPAKSALVEEGNGFGYPA